MLRIFCYHNPDSWCDSVILLEMIEQDLKFSFASGHDDGNLVQHHTCGEKPINREEWEVGVGLRKCELVICMWYMSLRERIQWPLNHENQET